MARRTEPQPVGDAGCPELAMVEYRRARLQPRGGLPGTLPEIRDGSRPRRLTPAQPQPRYQRASSKMSGGFEDHALPVSLEAALSRIVRPAPFRLSDE